MSWVIDQFSVKPTGFLASWRYRRVLTDENGTITSECISGKECMNLPCISDYNKKSRRYSNYPDEGSLITQYCNTITHTLFKVYAQDCEPFAVAQEVLDEPACGYMTPLPTPAVPPNPFGNATYGLRYFYEFCDDSFNPCRVNIYRKSYIGDPLQIENGGSSPAVHEYLSQEDNKYNPVVGSQFTATFISNVNFALKDLYENDEREFKIEFIYDGVTKFVGWISPDSCSEPFIAPGYPVSIRATDSLGMLKKVSYPLPVGSSLDIRQNFISMLAYCLSQTNLNLDIKTICNLYERKMATDLNDDPLAQASVNPLRVTDGGTVMTCHEVLEHLSQLFGACIAQIDGSWRFVRINEMPLAIIRMRTYDHTARFMFAENVINAYIAGNNQELQIVEGGLIRIGDAYKRAVVQLEYGQVPAIVYNGDFEQWDGSNFRYWTRYGGINVTRLQKEIPGNGGVPLPIQDYAALFNSVAVAGKWLQANPIDVITGDKIKLSMQCGNPLSSGRNQASRAYDLIIRVQVGEYYLSNAPNPFTTRPGGVPLVVDAGYTWVKSISSAVIRNATGGDSVNYRSIAIDMPEIPVAVDGEMIIRIFGFQNPQGATIAVDPIPIDNVGISKTSIDNSHPDGFLYISEQLQFFTQEPETTELIFGDFSQGSSLRPPRDPAAIPNQIASLNTLYAIYTADNSFSTGWKEYASQGDYLPIGLALAYNILKSYQQPYKFYEGAFIGNINYMDVFNIFVPDDGLFSSYTFSQLGVTYDYKQRTVSGTFVQILSKNLNSTNVSLPHLPGTNPPPFVQNPNNPSPISGDGIFTPQFTEQFV